MTNTTVKAVLNDNKMLATRERTDRLFPFPAGSFDYRGPLDHAIRFIEDFQLLDHSAYQLPHS
jgi:hypothetical protein